MMASEKEMFHRHQQDSAQTEMSPHQQYQAMMSGRAGQFVCNYTQIPVQCLIAPLARAVIVLKGIFHRFDGELRFEILSKNFAVKRHSYCVKLLRKCCQKYCSKPNCRITSSTMKLGMVIFRSTYMAIFQ